MNNPQAKLRGILLINKTNLTILILVICVSLIFGLPHLLIPAFLGQESSSYTPLVAGLESVCGITHDESLFYAAQLKEIFDGKPFFSDVDLYEYRNTPNPFSTFPYFLLGNFAKLLGSVQRLFIFADFIFPPLIFLFSYIFLLSLTEEALVSIFGSMLLVFGLDMLRSVSAIVKAWSGYQYAFWNFPPNNPLSLSRFINPEFSLPFFLLALFSFHRCIKEKSLFYSILSGILLGMLFHSYIYFWTFFLAGISILFLFYLFKKDFLRIKLILLVIGIGVLISIPYFMRQIEFSKFVNHDDILSRYGLVKGRFVEWHSTIECLIAIFLLFIYKKVKDDDFLFLFSFMVGGIICINSQIITGSTIQNHHWLFLTIQPFFIFILSFLISRFAKKQKESHFRRKMNFSLILKFLIVFLLVSGLVKQTVYASRTYSTYTLTNEESELFTWLKENSKRDDVVLSLNRRINDLIPVYTYNKIFLPNGILTFASDEEIIRRLIISFKLYGTDEAYLKENLSKDEWGFHLFHVKYAKVFYGEREVFPDKVLNDILVKYRSLSSSSMYGDFRKNRLDYIYLGTFEKGISGNIFGDNLALKEVFNKNGNRLYKVMFPQKQ